jgi:Tol biopolymer transport system component
VHAQRGIGGRRLLAGAAAAVLVGVLVGAGASPAGSERARAGTIAFLRGSSGAGTPDSSLFTIRADGSGLRRVTPLTTTVWSYAWSPNGRLIAYIDQRLSLWLVRPDGTGQRSLLPASTMSSVALSWSPDGKEIAVVSPGPDANPRAVACAKLALYVVPVAGGKPVRVSPPRRGIGCGVAWSPLGGEIAYGDGGEVLGVISRSGGRPRLLLSSGVGAPQWSPDGKKLAAATVIHLGHLRTVRYRRITVVNADGSGRHVVTDHAYTEYPFAWSPNSRQILYGKQDRQGIYVIGADGRGDHRVTRDSPPEGGWGALAWSPDGGSIVYATDRTGEGDLYLIDADGRNRVRLTSSPDVDVAPSWSPR